VRFLKMACAAALVWLEVGCGLPSPYFLAAPVAGILVAGGPTASFGNPGSLLGSQTTLAGFEVYYKFSVTTPSGNDINLGGGGTPGPGVLQANGFYPMCLYLVDSPPISRTAPMISISGSDAPSTFTITLTISTAAASTSSYTSPSTLSTVTQQIGRYVSYTSAPTNSRAFASNNLFSSPSPDYTPTDTDVQAVYSQAQSLGNVYVILYAITYGFQLGTSVVQYSTPTYLGYIQITSFP